MKLTKDHIKAMLPGQTLIVKCDDVNEWQSAQQIAYIARREMKLPSEVLSIARVAKELTVTIKRNK